MKAVILAGGMGTRLTEETQVRPKPMVEIGGKPLLWHIMKGYAANGIQEFIVCLGYKGYYIKEYFANYYLHASDVTFDLSSGTEQVHQATAEPWKVTLVETGETTMTGGRLKRVLPYVGDEDFCFTYGDGVSDLNIAELIEFHRQQGRLATITAVQPPGRFGALEADGDKVSAFVEKPHGDGSWINGGFFVLSPRIGDYIEGDHTVWERDPLERLARDGELSAYRYQGFWQMMDTVRDKNLLEDLWARGAPWKVW
jgi:glucose-1-phosphate cytidylyltransferase